MIGAMAATTEERRASRPILLCFDGSEDAGNAIEEAATVLRPGSSAVVLTVSEPSPTYERYDPATILTAPVSKLASRTLELDEIAQEVAADTLEQGVSLAAAAGFAAHGRIAHGKPWRKICDVAEEIGASTIVLGARGLSRMESVLLGSVSSAVAVHAKRAVLIVPRERD
jgi:nucleotide-binding universal stress UspA family protein